MRTLSLPTCSFRFHDAITNFLQLKYSPNLHFFPTKQFAELAELLKANAPILAHPKVKRKKKLINYVKKSYLLVAS